MKSILVQSIYRVALLFCLVLIPSQLFAFEFTESVYITEDTTWTKAESPYVLRDDVSVEIDLATLTIEPGVVIKFGEDTALLLYDHVVVQGSASDPVTFTSLKDDSVLGDTNGDGNLSFPSDQDDWFVWLRGLSGDASGVIEHAVFQYSKYGLYINDAEAVVRNVTFATSSDTLSLGQVESVTIEDVSLRNISGYGIGVFSCDSLSMKNIVVDTIWEDAVVIQRCTADLEDIEVSHVFGATALEVFDSEVTIDGIFVHDMFFGNQGIDLYRSTLNVHNALLQDFDLYNAAILGYNSEAIVTDSILKDGFGRGIDMYVSGGNPSALGLEVSGTLVENFSDYGISVGDTNTQLTDSIIRNNGDGIVVWGRDLLGTIKTNISSSSVAENIFSGVRNVSRTGIVNAQQNWWGDVSGPYHGVDNPGGLGDVIVGNVDFSNWLTAPPGELPVNDIDSLLLQYAPVLYMHPDEDYFPMNVEAFVEGSALWDQSGIDSQKRTESELTFTEFETITENDDTSDYYLAFSDPDNAKSIDLLEAKRKYDQSIASGAATTTVYVHRMEDSFTDDQGTHEFIVLQYWYFYAMNNWREQGGRNNHEGDWESVFIFLDKDTEDPVYVAHSSHLNDGDPSLLHFQYDSVRRKWGSDEVSNDNGQIVSFVSLGSHANYFNNANNGEHVVDLAVSDFTSPGGLHFRSTDFITETFSDEMWFGLYEGKWGADGVALGTDGPQGPNFIDVGGTTRFHNPVEWAGLDKISNVTVSTPESIFNFASSSVVMQFSAIVESGTELSASLHDEFISFGQNIGNINFLPQFWDFETSLVNGSFNVAVTLSYLQEQLAVWGLDEEFMQVYFYNDLENLWEPVQSRIDSVTGQIQFDTDHFSRYAIGSPVLTPVNEGIIVKSHLGKYDQSTDTREAFVTLHNKGTNILAGDIRVVIRDVSTSEIELLDATGITTAGDYFVDIQIDPLPVNEKVILPALLFTLPTQINASPEASQSAQKENAEFKQFDFDAEVYIFN